MWLHTSSISDSRVYMSMFLVLDHDDIKDVIRFITLFWDIEGFIMVYTPSDFFWFTFCMRQIVADILTTSSSLHSSTIPNRNGLRIVADVLTGNSSHNRPNFSSRNGRQIGAAVLITRSSLHRPT